MSARSALATAAVAATAAATLAVPAQAATGELTGGLFGWPIKGSFMKHLQTSPLAQGKLVATGGAEFRDSQFVFPVDTDKTSIDASGNGTIYLDGQAHLEAYPGLGKDGGLGLNATYSDLRIQVRGTSATLVGDYSVTGDPGDKDKPVDLAGDDVQLVTFELASAIKPGHDNATIDVPTVAQQGIADSLLRYEVGQKFDDGATDLVLDYDDGQVAPDVNGKVLGGVDKLSSQIAQASSGTSSASQILGWAGGLTALLAVLGTVAAAWQGLIPGVQIPANLA